MLIGRLSFEFFNKTRLFSAHERATVLLVSESSISGILSTSTNGLENTPSFIFDSSTLFTALSINDTEISPLSTAFFKGSL